MSTSSISTLSPPTLPLCSVAKSLILRIKFTKYRLGDIFSSEVDRLDDHKHEDRTFSAPISPRRRLRLYCRRDAYLDSRLSDDFCHIKARRYTKFKIPGRRLIVVFKRFVGTGRKRRELPCGHCRVCFPFTQIFIDDIERFNPLLLSVPQVETAAPLFFSQQDIKAETSPSYAISALLPSTDKFPSNKVAIATECFQRPCLNYVHDMKKIRLQQYLITSDQRAWTVRAKDRLGGQIRGGIRYSRPSRRIRRMMAITMRSRFTNSHSRPGRRIAQRVRKKVMTQGKHRHDEQHSPLLTTSPDKSKDPDEEAQIKREPSPAIMTRETQAMNKEVPTTESSASSTSSPLSSCSGSSILESDPPSDSSMTLPSYSPHTDDAIDLGVFDVAHSVCNPPALPLRSKRKAVNNMPTLEEDWWKGRKRHRLLTPSTSIAEVSSANGVNTVASTIGDGSKRKQVSEVSAQVENDLAAVAEGERFEKYEHGMNDMPSISQGNLVRSSDQICLHPVEVSSREDDNASDGSSELSWENMSIEE